VHNLQYTKWSNAAAVLAHDYVPQHTQAHTANTAANGQNNHCNAAAQLAQNPPQ